jgi:hypothetical protein
MTNSEALEFSVLERLSFCAPVSLEELLHILPGHSWNQLFAAIDGLSRRGAITLLRIDRCTYHISLGPYSRPDGQHPERAMSHPPAAIRSHSPVRSHW